MSEESKEESKNVQGVDYKETIAVPVDVEAQIPIPVIADANVQQPRDYDRVVYVQYREPPIDDTENDPMVGCALCGLFFSWIPLIGFATFCLNLDAPRTSTRFSLAYCACLISTIVVFINIIFWSMY